jgi:proteasome lid subunit RPN8/RPN11
LALPAEASLSAALRREIIGGARAALPNEAVGLLVAAHSFAAGGVPSRYLPLRNAAASPYRFSIDAREQLAAWLEVERRHEVVWGIVHSHVSTAAVPSATDIELAFFPDSLYLICSLAGEQPGICAWSIRDGGAHEVPLAVSP